MTEDGVKSSPWRADFVGASRNGVALAASHADISLENVVMAMKYPS
jgi:hypothetical protein